MQFCGSEVGVAGNDGVGGPAAFSGGLQYSRIRHGTKAIIPPRFTGMRIASADYTEFELKMARIALKLKSLSGCSPSRPKPMANSC